MFAPFVPFRSFVRRLPCAVAGAVIATSTVFGTPLVLAGPGPAAAVAPLGVRGPETAIVILGYGLLPDGSMRPELVDRLTAGYVQAVLAPLSPIVVTGGNPHNGVTEADAMTAWLVEHGIAAERIHREPQADSTVQNALFSAMILREIGARDAVIVTSADHIDRAVANFLGAGVQVVSAVTPEQVPPFAVPTPLHW
ncbi:YdcF family protein [Nocardia sp. AG03]|uniref:YdcF family protein n=1 Tax=Nocardia sp. AG03 TaxID=3025312 RepID=UPI0024181D44|nr:YdcF family protein [Nocardia sp. AG03]